MSENKIFKSRTNSDISSVVYGKVPPQSQELEEAVIGALLIDKDAFYSVEFLKPTDFYDDRHRILFNAISTMYLTGKQVDILTVCDFLASSNELEQAGGMFYVSTITNRVTGAAHIEQHSRIIQNKAIKRNLIRLGQETVHKAYEDFTEVDEIINDIENTLNETNSATTNSEIKNMAQVSSEIEKQKAENSTNKKKSGIAPALKDVKHKIHQYQNGDLIIIAARASMGKTAWAVSEILELAKMGVRIGLISMEMKSSDIYWRLVTAECGFDMHTVMNPNDITSADFTKISEARALVNNLPIFIDDLPNPTLNHFNSRYKRMIRKFSVDIIYADHLGKISVPGLEKDQYTMVTIIARSVKATAKKSDIPLVMLTQLSRKTEGRKDMRPMLSDLKDSGAIEEEADLVGLLYRPEYYKDQGLPNYDLVMLRGEKISTNGYAEVNFAKNRNGPTGLVPLTYVKHCMKFDNYNSAMVREHLNNQHKPDLNFDSIGKGKAPGLFG